MLLQVHAGQAQRPVDAVTAAVLRLQMAQRAVNTVIEDLAESVSTDPFGESSRPEFRLKLSELRSAVDQAVDELIDALARMGEGLPARAEAQLA